MLDKPHGQDLDFRRHQGRGGRRETDRACRPRSHSRATVFQYNRAEYFSWARGLAAVGFVFASRDAYQWLTRQIALWRPDGSGAGRRTQQRQHALLSAARQ